MADLESELARFEAEIRASSEASASVLPPPPQPSASHPTGAHALYLLHVQAGSSIHLMLPDRVKTAAYRQLRYPLHPADPLAMAMPLMPLLAPPLGLNTPHMVCALTGTPVAFI